MMGFAKSGVSNSINKESNDGISDVDELSVAGRMMTAGGKSMFGGGGAGSIRRVFDAVPTAKQRTEFLDVVCKTYKVRKAPFSLRVKLLQKAIDKKIAARESNGRTPSMHFLSVNAQSGNPLTHDDDDDALEAELDDDVATLYL